MFWHFPQREHGAEDLVDQLGETATFRWGIGVLAPLAMAFVGSCAIVSQSTSFGGSHASIPLHGLNAITLGVAWIGAALFTHCRMFWGSLVADHWLVTLGEIIGAAGVVLALVTLIVRVGALNLR